MPRLKRARSTSSDDGSSYKQSNGEFDSDAEVVKSTTTPRKRIAMRRRIITSEPRTPDRTQLATTSDSAVPKKETPNSYTPGKLLAALSALNNETNQSSSPRSRKKGSGTGTTRDTKEVAFPNPQSDDESIPGLRTPPSSPSKSQKGSPSKKKSPQKKLVDTLPIPSPKPEEEWRRTDIPPGLRITKGNAQKLFHLTAEELTKSGLKFDQEKRPRGLTGSMYLYSMRAVERIAWKKHGSPEGYDTAIENARKLWVAKGKDHLTFPFVPRPFRSYRRTRCKSCGQAFETATHLITDKCDTCSGIIRPVSRSVVVGPMDIGEFADYDAYDGEPRDEENFEEEREVNFCDCDTCAAIAGVFARYR